MSRRGFTVGPTLLVDQDDVRVVTGSKALEFWERPLDARRAPGGGPGLVRRVLAV